MAVLFMRALAHAIVKRYTLRPKVFDCETNLLILTIKYSNILVFCNPWLSINNNAIVITAGLEKPEIASSTVKKPPANKIDNINKAVTSRLNFSDIKRTKARTINPKTNKISKVI